MNDYEKLGRYLCSSYYSGLIKPYVVERTLEARIVEETLRRGPGLWRTLFCGDLAHENARIRGRFLGRVVSEKDILGNIMYSIDGSEQLRENELAMYSAVAVRYVYTFLATV